MKLIVKYILLVFIILWDKKVLGQIYFPFREIFFEVWPCFGLNVVSCGSSEALCE